MPFMPLAKSGADLGPDLHLSKLFVREGVIEAEGIVIVRPPTSLTVEQAQKKNKVCKKKNSLESLYTLHACHSSDYPRVLTFQGFFFLILPGDCAAGRGGAGT